MGALSAHMPDCDSNASDKYHTGDVDVTVVKTDVAVD